MFRITLRSIWEHKRRLISTILAIVLGVAFMSGTLVFADTIDKVFEDLFSDVNENVDVQVQGIELFDSGFGGPAARGLIDPGIVDVIATIEGVEAAAPFADTIGFGSTNRLLDADGDTIGATNGPPTLLEAWIEDEELNPYSLTNGSQPPTEPGHIALNVAAAKGADVSIGDPITVLSQFGESTYTLVGTFRFGEADSAAGAVSAAFTLGELQHLAGFGDKVEAVLARGSGGPDVLVQRVQDRLGADVEVITGQEAADQTAAAVTEGFGFFRVILLVFGIIALVVGTFIIANTFSILIAQRTRELALLRAIGASRRQVLGSVLLEAMVIGLVASVLGLLVGVLLALGLTELIKASGGDFPTTGLVIAPTTILVAFGAGLGVSMSASIFPAIQATRVPPIAALREIAAGRNRVSRIRVASGVLTLVLGLLMLSFAFRDDVDSDALPIVGFGGFLMIVGTIVIGPAVAEPLVQAIGSWLPRVRGITGLLAKENAARSPKRTSATASALLIGVTLIGFITIFGASAQASVDAEINRGFRADLVVQSQAQGFGPPGVFPASVAETVAGVEGVAIVSRVGFTDALVETPDGNASTTFLQSIDPETVLLGFEPDMATGEVTDLEPGGVIVDVEIMEERMLRLGDLVTFTGTSGQKKALRIDAVADDFTLLGFFTTTNEDLVSLVTEHQLAQVIVSLADGASPKDTQDRIELALERVPAIDVLDKDGFVGSITDQITSFLTIVQGLLGLSVIIAMIGIANTLSLSIYERTRELGLLRAVGMTHGQIRATVRWEAVLISLLGTVGGLLLGFLLSWSLVSALDSFGLTKFSVPYGSVLVVALFMGALGILSSLRPAYRAARLNVLAAIASE